MGYVPDDVIAAMRGSHSLGIFFRMDTNPALHLWMGINDIPAEFDHAIDLEGTVYLGGGRLAGIPTLEVLINGVADRVEFQMSGISPEDAERIDTEAPPVRGATVHVGIVPLDQYYQPMGYIVPLWIGTASFTTEKSSPVTGREQPTITMGLSVGSGSTTRSRKSTALWSPAQQKALYPTDLFCNGTARLARGVAPSWPRF